MAYLPGGNGKKGNFLGIENSTRKASDRRKNMAYVETVEWNVLEQYRESQLGREEIGNIRRQNEGDLGETV